uniref:hypothetical protein Ycf58 n=1 Tax=Aphanocladia delicatula TaxID=3041656 RepID=UPI002551D7ED|nr:hypothetical protein Ycf58 [Aphanocladia delicatula]WGH14212.1 hypothetical protein Ycf58 [Aphanocladia delicatula]
MNNNLYPLLEYIKGNWFVQENFYFISNKKQKQCKARVNFLNSFSQNNILDINKYCIENINDQIFILKLKHDVNNLVISKRMNYINKFNYQEFIYIISNNFMISFIIVKNVQKNQYMGLKISSYIRLIQQ